MKLTGYWNKLVMAPADEGGSGAGADPAADPVTEENAAAQDDAPNFDWVGADFMKDGKPDWDGFKAHHENLISEKAQRDEAAADVPEDGKYDFGLPDDFDFGVELPAGVKVQIDTENPAFADLGAFLKEQGVSRSTAQGLIGHLAKYEAQRTAGLHAAAAKEFEQLGATDAVRNARVAAVERSLQAKLPKDMADALLGATYSAAGVKALEKLLQPRSVAPATSKPDGIDDSLTGTARLRAARERQSI